MFFLLLLFGVWGKANLFTEGPDAYQLGCCISAYGIFAERLLYFLIYRDFTTPVR